MVLEIDTIIIPEVEQVNSAQISLAQNIDMDALIIRDQGNATLLCLHGERVSIFVNNP